jgi:hypothetical protein
MLDWRETVIKSHLRVSLLLLIAFAIVGCRRTPNPAVAHRILTGKWSLVIRHDCQDWGIESDILILHSDGRLEQHLKFLNGKKFESAHEHWEYSADNGIFLNRRLTASAGTPETEGLIVEFSEPPVIVLNPDQDCFYQKSSSEEQ